MSDETKAGIVSISWLVVFAVFAVEPSVVKGLVLFFITVIELLYCKHDVEREQLRRREQRERSYASETLRRELDKPADPRTESERLTEEKYRYYTGG